jgi:hypothetical protein
MQREVQGDTRSKENFLTIVMQRKKITKKANKNWKERGRKNTQK